MSEERVVRPKYLYSVTSRWVAFPLLLQPSSSVISNAYPISRTIALAGNPGFCRSFYVRKVVYITYNRLGKLCAIVQILGCTEYCTSIRSITLRTDTSASPEMTLVMPQYGRTCRSVAALTKIVKHSRTVTIALAAASSELPSYLSTMVARQPQESVLRTP